MNLPRPGAPSPAGGDLAEQGSQVVEKAGIRTERSAPCLCALNGRKERSGDREVDGVAAPLSGEPRPPQCPSCQGPLTCHTQYLASYAH